MQRIDVMLINREQYEMISKIIKENRATLVAVSKTKPAEAIQELYDLGHRDFGENYVQELTGKYEALPKDIQWHFIGHLQSNKVKYIAPFIHLIHGVDSTKLLQEINRQGSKNNRVINILLQVHIAREETKYGFDEKELKELLENDPSQLASLKNIKIMGLMGMASFTEDMQQVKNEFRYLRSLFDRYADLKFGNIHFSVLSMGMSSDYQLALQEGSNMVRIGSLLFGERSYAK